MASLNEVTKAILDNRKEAIEFAMYAYQLNKERAEDIIGDSVLSVLENYEKLDDIKNFKKWFYFIIKNKFINVHRKLTRYPHGGLCVDPVSDYHDRKIESSDFYDKIMGALGKNKEVEAIKMYSEGYEYHEIAEKYAIPMGTVKSRIHKVRKRAEELALSM